MSEEITTKDVESTYLVLETIRDEILEEPAHHTLNGAHDLVQEFEPELLDEQ